MSLARYPPGENKTGDIPKLDPNAKYTPHTISIVVMNKPGVLDVVTGVFARRGYNVQSLGVGPEKSFDISRISTVRPEPTGWGEGNVSRCMVSDVRHVFARLFVVSTRGGGAGWTGGGRYQLKCAAPRRGRPTS